MNRKTSPQCNSVSLSAIIAARCPGGGDIGRFRLCRHDQLGAGGQRRQCQDPATGHGAVAYNYSIDKYDVTVGQYTDFLNAVAATDTYGLYHHASMGTNLNIAGISRSGSSGSYPTA